MGAPGADLRLRIAEAERLPGSSNAYFDAMFASTYQRLSVYLAERYTMDHADSADLIGRTVLPRLFRTLLNVEKVLKDAPEETALAGQVDLTTIRRPVSAALPS